MAPSWFKLVLVIALAFVLFGGRGKISELMGDFAKGIKSFKRGLSDDPEEPDTAAKAIEDRAGDGVEARPASAETLRA
jgi:sec-independent protein translocase protein TatA